MIDLVCPQCSTKLPVAENKIGTRIFVCPQCAHPLDTPAPPSPETPVASPPGPAAPDFAEDKTVAPDPSLAHVQKKLQAIAARRASQESETPAASEPQPALSKGLILGGLGVMGLVGVAAALLLLVVAGIVGVVLYRSKSASPQTPVATPKTEPATVTALTKDVKEGDAPTRKNALQELSKRGKDARPALAVVLPLLADADGDTRTLARDALAQMGPPTKDDLPIFAAALRDSSPEVRTYAIERCGDLGKQAQTELVYLRVLAQDEDETVQKAALKAVARIEEELLGSLTKGLQTKDIRERSAAARGLAEMGANARPA